MITVKYRLLGKVEYPVLSKTFESNAEFEQWKKEAAYNLLIIDIEYSGAATLNRLYGPR